MFCRSIIRKCRAVAAIVAAIGLITAVLTARAVAVDVSAPAMLQLFEARWDTIENRMADIFQAGYGQMWLPPPQRADTSNLSVGYDLFDRFDLGGPRNETLYGTMKSLQANVNAAHAAGVKVYTDFIPNHNGFGDSDDAPFIALGGYPGFVLTLPEDQFGDFHDPTINFDQNPLEGKLAGLVDIAQEKEHEFIRHPVEVGNPDNIPAGTTYNLPDPNNARFYTDQDLGGVQLTDPALGGTIFTRYQFNLNSPLEGDPIVENATGLLMRSMQYMIQVVGVDGFRVDAAKHVPTWVMNYLDNAVFRTSLRTNHDGTIQPVFMFSEVLDGNKGLLQSYIRKDLPNPLAISQSNTTVGGNRDALDFPLFYAMRDNLTGNGLANNWHGIRTASQDTQDDGLRNGSQGVAFVDSHDNLGGGFPFLKNVAYAYILMKPGNALVYHNALEFGENRDFPNDGKDDALGGFHGDTITTLVNLRNSHGRGNFHERWIDEAFGDENGDGQKSNIYIYERENSAVVGLNSRLDTGFDERTPVQTGFAPGTVLVELTGNAADPVVNFNGSVPETIRVDGNGRVTMRVPRNSYVDIGDPEDSEDDEEKIHGRGYVVYGVSGPQGTLSLSGVSSTMPGTTPTAANNGTARLADIDVITADSFGVRLDTTPVTLPAPMGEMDPVRDFDADGDQAVIRIDGGMDLNNLPGIDRPNPADISYAFEDFTDTRVPGYIDDGMGGNTGSGTGQYDQTIDATQFSEGRHYITVRAFRHRGVAGTPVFTDFRRTIYVDRLPPDAEIVSFEAYATEPGNPNNRDLIVRSVDGTADNMHMYFDLPANMSDAEIFALTQMGVNDAGQFDRDSFVFGFDGTTTTTGGVSTGNHVTTVVTFEPTGTYNIQRFAGLFTDTNIGAGFGDLNNSGTFTVSDILGSGNNSAEDVLYSQNDKFSAAFDVNGDGLGDNRDLFALGDELVAAGAGQAVLDAYVSLLLKRGDLDGSGTTDVADLATLYSNLGPATWLLDLNVDGVVDAADAETFITQLVRTVPGDYNLDGSVDAADYTAWRDRMGGSGVALVADGDFDGAVDENDFEVWRAAFGFHRQPLTAGSAAAAVAAVPEPATARLLIVLLMMIGWRSGAGRR